MQARQRQEQLEQEKAQWAAQQAAQQMITRQIHSAATTQSQPVPQNLALQKAIFELAGSMSPHLAADALKTLAATAGVTCSADGGYSGGTSGTGGNVQVVRMLAELIEQQQDRSVCKLVNILQTRAPGHPLPPPLVGNWQAPPLPANDPMQQNAFRATPQIPPHLAQHLARASQHQSSDDQMGGSAWSQQGAQWKPPGQTNRHQPRPTQARVPPPPGIVTTPHQQFRDSRGVTFASNTPANCRRHRPQAAPPGAEEETLRSHLRDLQTVDSSRIVLVRKINRLGFDSPKMLEDHYKNYGCVERVLVAHSHVKSPYRRYVKRLRPSGLGFVVMSSIAEVDAILKDGIEQSVAGALIKVQRFERRGDEFDSLMSEETGTETWNDDTTEDVDCVDSP